MRWLLISRGLKGDTILNEAKIIAVTDAIEDLTYNRINRPALPIEKTLAGVGNYSGAKYDPNVVAACLKLSNEKGYKIEG